MKLDEIERKELDLWYSAHLAFRDDGPVKVGAKTRLYSVFNRSNQSLLGYIKWWPRWRKYVFVPLNTVFDDKCLLQVAQFVKEATDIHKSRLPNKKRLRDMELARRQRRIEQLALTKQQNNVSMDSVVEVVQPENGLVEGSQFNLTPLEIELGTITV